MNKVNTQFISIPKPLFKKDGIVILPLEEFENFKEDLEMLSSKNFAKEIAEAREEVERGEIYTIEEVEKILGI